VLNKAMYTSFGFGKVGGKSCNFNFENDEFLSIQRRKIKEYCDSHSIPLHAIGYNHKYMSRILSNTDPELENDSKKHSVYTLSAIAAIFDFCDSEYDEFYWMHLDMVFNKPDINIFDTFEINDDTIYNWEWASMYTYGYDDWQKEKFRLRRNLLDYFGIKYDVDDVNLHFFSNCSTIMMKKKAAIRFRDAILEHIDFINTKNSNICHIEETVMEVINYLYGDINMAPIHSIKTINEYEGELFPITFKSVYGQEDKCNHKDSVFIHYWGENKKDIADFYRARGIL